MIVVSDYYVYLAGGINGLTYEEANEWRLSMGRKLALVNHDLRHKVVFLSPMRGKAELVGEVITQENTSSKCTPVYTDKGIVCRDYNDIVRSDLVIVNLLGATDVVGTLVEIGIAYALRKPIILVMEEDNKYNHPFVTVTADYGVQTLDEAIIVLCSFFE